MRRLENESLRLLRHDGQISLGGDFSPIRVSIGQFYGIELNDFAVSVARTALWIAEVQMKQETETIVGQDLGYLPLKSYPNITEANALRIDWNTVCPATNMNYVMGNPPFTGARVMRQGSEQKSEIQDLFGKIKDVQDLDYVCGWYKKAAEYIQRTNIEVAFVSTNSISQGAQVPVLWNVLLNKCNVHINFAYRTFRWDSEATEKAAVNCVIVGFGMNERIVKELYDSFGKRVVKNISPYLTEGGNILVTARNTPICDVPKMSFGNQPRDGGFLIVGKEEHDEMLETSPGVARWLRPYIGAEEFINGKQRWCLWLKGASPSDIKNNPLIYDRASKVREFRLSSKAKTTNGYARVPHLFAQITQPDDVDFLLIPRVSSERREYIPIGFMARRNITSDAVQIIPGATLYHFGVLTSSVHMAWTRTVCGRLEMRYRYSKDIVYNNFPWPSVDDEQTGRIAAAARAVLDARALFPDSTLADLYDPVTMPLELRKAHKQLDHMVLAIYGIPATADDEQIIAHLFGLYISMA